VHLVAEGVADLLAPGPQLGTRRDHLVVGLDYGQLGDPTIEPAAPEFAPAGSHRSKAQLHHGLKGEQDGSGPYQGSVTIGQWTWPIVEQPADDHGVHDNAHRRGDCHVSAKTS